MKFLVIAIYACSSLSLLISAALMIANDETSSQASALVRDIGFITSFCVFVIFGFVLLRRKKFSKIRIGVLLYLGIIINQVGGLIGIIQTRNASLDSFAAYRLIETCLVIGTVAIIVAGVYIEDISGKQLALKWIAIIFVALNSVGMGFYFLSTRFDVALILLSVATVGTVSSVLVMKNIS